MSRTYKPVGRKTGMIGMNIRPGMVPGSFTGTLGAGKRIIRKRTISSTAVKEAAIEALAKRGISRQQPDIHFDITQKKIPPEFR